MRLLSDPDREPWWRGRGSPGGLSAHALCGLSVCRSPLSHATPRNCGSCSAQVAYRTGLLLSLPPGRDSRPSARLADPSARREGRRGAHDAAGTMLTVLRAGRVPGRRYDPSYRRGRGLRGLRNGSPPLHRSNGKRGERQLGCGWSPPRDCTTGPRRKEPTPFPGRVASRGWCVRWQSAGVRGGGGQQKSEERAGGGSPARPSPGAPSLGPGAPGGYVQVSTAGQRFFGEFSSRWATSEPLGSAW